MRDGAGRDGAGRDGAGLPEVDPRRGQSQLRKRLEAQLATDVRKLRLAALAEWAAADDTPYPRMSELREQAEFELHTLLNGLGRWAAVAPDSVFPESRWRRRLP